MSEDGTRFPHLRAALDAVDTEPATWPPPDPALRDLAARIAAAFDVPPWIIGLEPAPPAPTGPAQVRARIARRIGQTGWDLGDLYARIARRLHEGAPTVANRITDAGDWLANLAAGPRS